MRNAVFIDIDKALKAGKNKKSANKPPDIEIISISVVREGPRSEIDVPEIIIPAPVRRTEGQQFKGDILVELEEQMRNLRIARARISNQYPDLVRKGASSRELAARYIEIESYTTEMQDVYTRIRHVERYGRLPDPEPGPTRILDSEDLMKLKKHLRSLIDKRCKLQAKLKPNAKVPKNSERYTMWALELDQVNLEYNKLKTRIQEVHDGQE